MSHPGDFDNLRKMHEKSFIGGSTRWLPQYRGA
jgi:hypothetical protein